MRVFIFFIISLFSINTLYLYTIPEVNLRETYSPENIITNLKNKLRPSIRPLLVKVGLKEKIPNENKKTYKYENKNRIFVFEIKENNLKNVYNREYFVINLNELSENEFNISEGPASLRKNTISTFHDLFSLNTKEQIIKIFDGYKTRKHFYYSEASILNPISFVLTNFVIHFRNYFYL